MRLRKSIAWFFRFEKNKNGDCRKPSLRSSSHKPINRHMQDIGQCTKLLVRYRALLPFEQRKCRNAHIHTDKLQLRQQLDLLHAPFHPRLRDPRADDILRSKLQFPRFQTNTPASLPIIRNRSVDIFGITKYNKFNTAKYGVSPMEYLEVCPLPAVCRSCADRKACLARREPEWCCDECDHLLERFIPLCKPSENKPACANASKS